MSFVSRDDDSGSNVETVDEMMNTTFIGDETAQLLSMFRGNVEAAVDRGLTDVEFVTDPLEDSHVAHLIACIKYQLMHILWPSKFTLANQDPNVLLIIAKNRVSEQEVVIKLNVPDAVNRLTTLTELYNEVSEYYEAEMELKMLEQIMGGKTEDP